MGQEAGYTKQLSNPILSLFNTPLEIEKIENALLEIFGFQESIPHQGI